MPDHTDAQNNLFITRHATQALLHSAFNALPSRTYGLLSGRNNIIQAVYPFDHNNRPDLSLARYIQSLESSGMNLLSLYISSAIHDEYADFLRGEVIHVCPATDTDELIRLIELPLVVVRLDTRGRMEVALLDKEDNTALPLILQDDGGLYPVRDKE